MKTIGTVAIGIVVLVLSTATIFTIYNVNPSIQNRPEQAQVSNYSAEIDTLKPQINSIKNNISSLSNNMSSLDSVKSDISDINGKLSALETKISQTQKTTTSTQPVMVVDRYPYSRGDIIHITSAGLDPKTTAYVQIVDSSGIVIMQRSTLTDFAGKVSFDFPLSFTIAPGNYEVRIVEGQKTSSQPITVTGFPLSVTLSRISYLFTAQTDKTVYHPADIIEVLGVGSPNTNVEGILTSPSGTTLTSDTTVQPDGSYSLFYTDSKPFESGSWSVNIQNQGLSRIVYLTVSGNPSSSVYPFTAQSSKSVYQAGDLILVSGIGKPFTSVSSVLTSPSGLTFDAATTTDSDGTYLLSYDTASWYEKGNWIVSLSNQGQSRQVSIFIGLASPSSSNTFTAQTDKTIFKKGDLIQISGTAKPFTNIGSIITSPSGAKYYGAAMANFDGSYNIDYSTSLSFETGNWHITLNNGGVTDVISIFVEPS